MMAAADRPAGRPANDRDGALSVDLPDEEATRTLGAALARQMRAGDVIALHGPLGAGKTALARAAIRTLMASPDLVVPSPSFTLVELYDAAPAPVVHLDAYRLDDPAETLELGWDADLARQITLIEWPERLGPFLPEDRLDIRLEAGADDTRRAVLVPAPGQGAVGWTARLTVLAGQLTRSDNR